MASKTIFLVMDLINDLVHEDGPNGKGEMGQECARRGVLSNTAVALDKARAANVPVGYVRVGFNEEHHEAGTVSPLFTQIKGFGILKLGTWGTEVHPAVSPQPGDYDIVKHRISPWFGTNLPLILNSLGVQRIVCCGVSTNYVVQSAVREGHDRDYEMVILEDCCSATSQDEHDYSIQGLARLSQVASATTFSF